MERLVEVTLEIDAELKEQAEKVFAENGMTLEEATILFFEETVRLGRLPFELDDDLREYIAKQLDTPASDSVGSVKTIRQIADEIGVSKQTVYKRYKGKLHTVCAPYAHTEQGVLYIEEQGETLIKQDFLQKECSVGAHTYAHTERSNGEVLEQSENVGVIAVLQTTIDTLQGQLAIKDKQIEDLNARLSESNAALVAAQQTAQAAQALHAGTIQQQLTSGTDQSEGSGDEPKKQGWFSRLFRG